MKPYNPTIHDRRSIRLKGYDYSQTGLYFITICCDNKICRFGKIVDNEMFLNDYGNIAFEEWAKTPSLRPQVELDVFIVMPNHIHAILKINDKPSMGELPSPNNTTIDDKHYEINDRRGVLHTPYITIDDKPRESNTPPRSPSQTLGAIVRGYKSSVTKQLGLMGFKGKLWQGNYYEHIIRNEPSYQTLAEYVINNPLKWTDDKFYMP